MKTIDEKAKEYAISTIDTATDASVSELREYAECDFKAGVEFAQCWIPVEVELPEENQSLTQTQSYVYTEDPFIVRTINGKYAISKRSKFKNNENSRWEWMGSSSFSDSVTHWRPITLK